MHRSGAVMTKLARDSMPPDTHGLLTDKPELAGGFAVCASPLSFPRRARAGRALQGERADSPDERAGLATQSKADFLRGRYVSANWVRLVLLSLLLSLLPLCCASFSHLSSLVVPRPPRPPSPPSRSFTDPLSLPLSLLRAQDVAELVKKAPDVVERDLLWTRVVGQEQVMPRSSQVHLY